MLEVTTVHMGDQTVCVALHSTLGYLPQVMLALPGGRQWLIPELNGFGFPPGDVVRNRAPGVTHIPFRMRLAVGFVAVRRACLARMATWVVTAVGVASRAIAAITVAAHVGSVTVTSCVTARRLVAGGRVGTDVVCSAAREIVRRATGMAARRLV
ncbi:hypothetical protein AQJ84_37520 [Streptomyces resistomycificus]|nr:hypothetical protein AQJ84_37520 [Streptomyces resistomycificus]